jgi:hypothetical protein
VPLIDLSGSDSDAQRLRDVYAAREAAVTIDLNRSLPVRAMLLRLAPQRFELLLTVSHIVADGSCLGILVGELRALPRRGSWPEGAPAGGGTLSAVRRGGRGSLRQRRAPAVHRVVAPAA